MGGKCRVVTTKIWKDKTFRKLEPLEKSLYLYLITNEHTALCGMYQTTMDEMSHDTGIELSTIPDMLRNFHNLGMAGFFDEEWVVIPNYLKHQNMNNPKVRSGVAHDLLMVPADVIAYAETIVPYVEPIDRTRATTTTTTTTTTTKESTDAAETAEVKPPPKLKNKFHNMIDEWFYERYEYTTFGKERNAVKLLASKAGRQAISTGKDPEEVVIAMMTAYEKLVTGRDKFWRKQPLTPSGLMAMWDRVISETVSKQPRELSQGGREFFDEK